VRTSATVSDRQDSRDERSARAVVIGVGKNSRQWHEFLSRASIGGYHQHRATTSGSTPRIKRSTSQGAENSSGTSSR
jgi:hypothetical protein